MKEEGWVHGRRGLSCLEQTLWICGFENNRIGGAKIGDVKKVEYYRVTNHHSHNFRSRGVE